MVGDDRARADAADQRAAVAAARPGWVWWMAMVSTVVVASGSSIFVSRINTDRAAAKVREAQHRSEQVWCEVITVLDEAYRNPASPPATEIGRRVAAGIARVRAAYHC